MRPRRYGDPTLDRGYYWADSEAERRRRVRWFLVGYVAGVVGALVGAFYLAGSVCPLLS